jgi:hypothetical protein
MSAESINCFLPPGKVTTGISPRHTASRSPHTVKPIYSAAFFKGIRRGHMGFPILCALSVSCLSCFFGFMCLLCARHPPAGARSGASVFLYLTEGQKPRRLPVYPPNRGVGKRTGFFHSRLLFVFANFLTVSISYALSVYLCLPSRLPSSVYRSVYRSVYHFTGH